MGRAIAAAVADDPRFTLNQDQGDVLLDFSAPAALQGSLDRALSSSVPVLIGTTGLDEAADDCIAAASRKVAVLRAANTSIGVALLADLVERAARVLGPDWDVEISETHHRMKADAPSGTALLLGEAVAMGRGSPLEAERARLGTGLQRRRGSIGFASLRGGTVAGDHDVLFLGPDERLILAHRAENRMIFARGALAAAAFLVGKPTGLYSMRDVIGASAA
jgi:4-hydroxy-tetrahydrodipicolinate reductase